MFDITHYDNSEVVIFHSETATDARGALIAAISAGANLDGANLRGVDLRGIDRTGVDLTHADLTDCIE